MPPTNRHIDKQSNTYEYESVKGNILYKLMKEGPSEKQYASHGVNALDKTIALLHESLLEDPLFAACNPHWIKYRAEVWTWKEYCKIRNLNALHTN